MEHAPLRPVPSRPAGPIDPELAMREVTAALPSLLEPEARALALVALAERPRAEVAATLGIDEASLGALLASARKELRRTVSVLGGSGWCERAEGLISDRLDGVLAEADTRRLDVHLRNCPRCVEHERRLVQATDWLLSGLAGPAPALPPSTAGPEAPIGEAPAEAPPEEAPPEEVPPPAEPPPEQAPPEEVPPPEAPPAEPPPEQASPAEAPAAAPPLEGAPAAAPAAAPAPTPDQVAAAAEVLVRTRRQVAAAVTWNALVVLAVLLALAAIGFTIAGIMGVGL